MKKRIFGMLLMGAMVIASMSMFTSCKDYDDDINNLQKQIDGLSTLVSTKESTINAEIGQLKSQLATLEALSKTLEGKISDGDKATLAAATQAVKDAKDALEKAIADNKTAADASIADLVAANATQDQKIVEAKAAADQAQTQLDELKTKLAADMAKLASKEELAAAVETINGVKASLATTNSQLDELKEKYATLSKDLKDAIADIAELKTALNGQKAALEAITGTTGDLTKAKADITDLLKRVKELEDQMDAVRNTEAGKVAKQISDINTTLEELAAAHAAFASKSDVNSLTSRVEGLENSVNTLEANINSVDSKINTIATALAKALRSLVYQPFLYVDGIESIQYPYLVDYKMKEDANVPAMNRQRTTAPFAETYVKTIAELSAAEKAKFPKLAKLNDWIPDATATDYEEWFAPVWPVSYHMNPSKSTTAWADVVGFNRRDAEVITRSDGGASIIAAEKYVDGSNVFSNANGTLTVGIQIPDAKHLANFATPTEGTGYNANPAFDGRPGYTYEDGTVATTRQYDDIVALQVNSRTKNDADTIITSDYAMIYPEQVKIEGMIWTAYHSKQGTTTVNFDENGYPCGLVDHVWDRPAEALACAGNNAVYPDIELYYNNTNGIVLKNLLGIHVTRRSNTLDGASAAAPATIKFTDADFARFGLTCEFQLVGYSVDGNITIDSNYAEFTDADEDGKSSTGTIRARNVKDDGSTIDTESATSVDREPLVRVFVKRGDRVLLDGYILVHITRNAPGQADPKVITNYPDQAYEFNLCDDGAVFSTNWSQFSYFVLTQSLDNMTKETFDASYGVPFDGVPDLYGTGQNPITGAATPVVLADNSSRYDDVVLYNGVYDASTGKWGNFTKCKATDLPGYVRYYHNAQGTTNHRFEWIITAEELEKLTHDAEVNNLPKTITKFFRYTGKAAAQYPYIYVKMTFDLTRATVALSGIKEKNINYWYKYTGADDGYDAVVWNPWFPQDGGNTKTFRQFLSSTFATNNVNFTNTAATYADNATAAVRNARAKFFFTPYEFQITSQKGVQYTITAKSGNADERWNAFVCKYDWYENDGTQQVFRWDATSHNLHWYSATNDKTYTEHKWGTPAQNKEIHEKCAIDYNDGVYNNTILYAVPTANYATAAAYTRIATLNPAITSGQMDLIWRTPDNDITKEILNAVGYEDAVHSNILKELNTMVGVIAHNGCGVAINVPEFVADEANTNAGTFYVSWQRPINTVTNANPMVDAKNNGDYIYTVDFLKLFDWRGPVNGKMYDENQWLWAYYNIKSVKIDVTPANVKTNMHQASTSTFVPLADVTTMARLGALNTTGAVTYNGNVTINLNGGAGLAAFNAANQNAALLTAMGLVPANNANKLAFAGGLYYENNGDNVTEFDVIVPVTVTYDWGEFISYVTVHIDRTLGN
jgi:predicted  nucleic acid-binding Zn-ribbon protein